MKKGTPSKEYAHDEQGNLTQEYLIMILYKGRYTITPKNLTGHLQEVRNIRLEGAGLRLLSVRVGVHDLLCHQKESVEFRGERLWWHPQTELFIEYESKSEQEITLILELLALQKDDPTGHP